MLNTTQLKQTNIKPYDINDIINVVYKKLKTQQKP